MLKHRVQESLSSVLSAMYLYRVDRRRVLKVVKKQSPHPLLRLYLVHLFDLLMFLHLTLEDLGLFVKLDYRIRFL